MSIGNIKWHQPAVTANASPKEHPKLGAVQCFRSGSALVSLTNKEITKSSYWNRSFQIAARRVTRQETSVVALT
jgi:hypothetical protein